VTKLLACINDLKLLRRSCSCKHNFFLSKIVHKESSFFRIIIVKGCFLSAFSSQVISMYYNCSALLYSSFWVNSLINQVNVDNDSRVIRSDYVYFLSYSSSCYWLVASNHNNFDSSVSAFCN